MEIGSLGMSWVIFGKGEMFLVMVVKIKVRYD